MKPETKFRNSKVNPFLKTLKNTWSVSVQQTSISGTPDKLLCVCGHFIALEIKARDGKLTALQAYTLDLIEKAGGVSLVASPDNWDEIKQVLIKLDQGEQ